jgi:hypothetical protein
VKSEKLAIFTFSVAEYLTLLLTTWECTPEDGDFPPFVLLP